MTVMSDEEVRAALAPLPGWEHSEGEIGKEYALDAFGDAVAFVVRLAFEAEARNHHPDIDIRYNRVRVTLSTHSEGGVTGKDLDLAAAIEALQSRRAQ